MRHPHNYDPNQPRVPKYHKGGGQWTRGGYGGQANVQVAFSDPRGAIIRQGVQRGIEAALALYTWLSARNSADRQTIAEFTAHEYVRDDADKLVLRNVRTLTREEVKKFCDRIDEVEERTEKAVLKTQTKGYKEPPEYGTDVHTELKRDINHEPDPDEPGSTLMNRTPPDPNLKAEVSMWKAIEDVKAATGITNVKLLHHAAKGTIRVDVLERVDDETVCVYDIKTGTSFRSGLDQKRRDEIARSVFKHFPGVRRIIITEIRPKTPRPQK